MSLNFIEACEHEYKRDDVELLVLYVGKTKPITYKCVKCGKRKTYEIQIPKDTYIEEELDNIYLKSYTR